MLLRTAINKEDYYEKKMIDCSKVENYFAEKLRLTGKQKLSDSTYICEITCGDCPLSRLNNGIGVHCSDFETFYPEKAIEIVQRWSDEHPQKTYLSEFLKNYPNTPLKDDGTPDSICPYKLGLMSMNYCIKGYNCVKCWNQPVEDNEEGEEND